MNLPTAVKVCFKKYFTCSDRASRSEYWYWVVFVNLLSVPVAILDRVIFHTPLDSSYGPMNIAVSVLLFIPGFGVWIRRLHDVNRSGYWYMISITIIGLIPLIYWSCRKGTVGENRFGPDPLAPQISGQA